MNLWNCTNIYYEGGEFYDNHILESNKIFKFNIKEFFYML